MNWLKLKDIEKRLTQHSVSEKEGFLFLAANWIIFGFTSFAIVIGQYGNPGVMVILVILPVIGVTPSFIANQKGDGRDFLKRLVLLHFAVGIRYFAFTVFLMIVGNIVESQIQNHDLIEFVLSGFSPFIVVGFYYHLAKSITRVSQTAS